MLCLLRRQGRSQGVAVLQASVNSTSKPSSDKTHSSTSSGPLVDDRGLVATYQVSLCRAACQGSGLQCAGSFMVQVDVTQATPIHVSVLRLDLTCSNAQKLGTYACPLKTYSERARVSARSVIDPWCR